MQCICHAWPGKPAFVFCHPLWPIFRAGQAGQSLDMSSCTRCQKPTINMCPHLGKLDAGPHILRSSAGCQGHPSIQAQGICHSAPLPSEGVPQYGSIGCSISPLQLLHITGRDSVVPGIQPA